MGVEIYRDIGTKLHQFMSAEGELVVAELIVAELTVARVNELSNNSAYPLQCRCVPLGVRVRLVGKL